LQGIQFAQNARITAMFNGREIVRIKFGKKGVRDSEIGIMHAQISFENLAAAINSFQPCADGNAATIISSQIRQRLFAFEDRGQP